MTDPLAAVLARADVWRGEAPAAAPVPTVASGFGALDAELPGGGWPRGQLTELLHEAAGLGELSLLLPALARLSGEGGRVVLVAPPYDAHAPAWAAAGVRLEAVCLIRPRSPRDALWAAVEALRCRGVAATLAWLHPLPVNSVRRLQVAAGSGGGCAFLFRPLALAAESSPAPLRLRLDSHAGRLRVALFKRRGLPSRAPLELDLSRPARYPHALAGAAPAGRSAVALA